jgi:hypothetical protein
MKYKAKKIMTPYGVFDSKSEYERFMILDHQQSIGVISDLQQQVRFEIIPKLVKQVTVHLKTKTKTVERVDEKAAHYTADFTYYKNGQYVIEEIKSEGTMLARDYPLRKKLIKQIIAKHNQEAGFEEWVFNEIVWQRKPKKKK